MEKFMGKDILVDQPDTKKSIMRTLATFQSVAVVIVCALFSAKIPSLIYHEESISLYGGLLGAAAAVFAIFMANLFANPASNFESEESNWHLFPMRVATMALAIAMMGFTLFLYIEFQWILIIVRISVVVGAVAVFAGAIMAWGKSG